MLVLSLGMSIAIPTPNKVSGGQSQDSVRVAGVFSDMHFNPDTGDVGGTEVFIVRSLQGNVPEYFALVQFAFGKTYDPVLVRVRLVGSGGIEFDMPDPVVGTFRGSVTPRELTGRFSGNGFAIRLQRGKSFYQ